MSQILTQILSESEQQPPAALYDTPRWYACYTHGRHEKRVATLLEERGIESYLPVRDQTRRWGNRRATVSLPVFPSYVFGRFALRELRRVLTTHGVATVVRVNGYPTPIPDGEIEEVRRLLESSGRCGAQPELEAMVEGDRVRITAGPFQGIQGVVMQRRGRTRVLVGLSAIGYGLSVEVDRGDCSRMAPA